MNKGGGGKTQTTTENSSTVYPAWTQGAGQNLFNTATNMTGPFLNASPFALAGFNPDQLKGFDLARQMTQSAFTGSPTAVPTGATMTAANANAAQLGANDYQQFMNPYINDVVNQAANKARGELKRTEADIGAKYAAAGAFGGSREVLARAKAQKDFDENLQETTANLLAQGYDRATASALANTQLKQQSNEANAQRQQEASAANMNYGLQAAQMMEAMRNGQNDRQNSALATILGTGSAQQALAQGALDLPWTMLQRLAGTVPQVYDTYQTGTATKPNTNPSAFQQLLGVGSGILSLGTAGGSSLGGDLLSKMFSSDETLKTDVQKVGTDEETGLPIMSYRYKGDPKSYPKVTGVMAQDVAKKYPEAVERRGGKLAVRAPEGSNLERLLGRHPQRASGR